MLPVSEDDRGMGGKATIAPTLAVASAGAGFELAATMAVPSDADYDSDGVAEGERGGGADFGGTMIVPPQGLMQGAARLEAPPQRGIDALWDGETQCFPDLADRNTGDEENDDEDAAGLVSQIDLQTDLGATRSRRGTPTTPGPDIIVVSSGEKPRPGPSTHFFDGETMETVASSGEDGIAGRSPDLGNATGNASGPREGGTGLGPFAVDPTLAPTMAPFDEFAPAHVQPDATSPIGESPPESLITKPKAGPIRRRRIVADSDTETESDEEELKLKSFGEVAKARGSSLALRNSSTGTLLPRAPATATSSSSIGFVKPTSPPVAPPASPVAPVPVDEPSFVPPMLKPALPTMLDADPLQILSTVAAYAIPEKVPAGGSGPSSRRSSASKSAARSGQSTRENSPTIAPQRAAAISSSTATANPAEHMYAPTLIECDDEEVVAPVAAVDDPRLATAAAPASPSTGAGSKRSSAATSRASSPGPAEGGPGVPAIADRKSRKRKLSKQAVNDAPAPSAAPTPLSTPVSLASPSVAAPVVAAANPAVPSAAVVEPVAPTTASKRKGKGSAKPAPEGATVPKRGRRGKGSASGGGRRRTGRAPIYFAARQLPSLFIETKQRSEPVSARWRIECQWRTRGIFVVKSDRRGTGTDCCSRGLRHLGPAIVKRETAGCGAFRK
ncbi:hypothetical protein DFJ73DRAFT_17863 [Zopfochytrium polystomum]|nr:hypothetical protein DFJ73DRAFT_17863 [Zopfochytrium polystomum]